MENKAEFILAAVVFVVVLAAGIGYYVWQDSQSSESQNIAEATQTTTSQGGTVAVFGQAESQQPSPDVAGATANGPEPTPADVQAATDEPYTLKLPSGWEQTDSKTEADPCTEGQEVKTDTYRNGSETLVVYENGHPDGCERTSVADVYLDYDFTEDASGLTIDTSSVVQCSKDDNPGCPKGDGRVSVFIGNESAEDPTLLRKNPKTNKSYFFSLTDTSIDPSFEQQVKDLVGLVTTIEF